MIRSPLFVGSAFSGMPLPPMTRLVCGEMISSKCSVTSSPFSSFCVSNKVPESLPGSPVHPSSSPEQYRSGYPPPAWSSSRALPRWRRWALIACILVLSFLVLGIPGAISVTRLERSGVCVFPWWILRFCHPWWEPFYRKWVFWCSHWTALWVCSARGPQGCPLDSFRWWWGTAPWRSDEILLRLQRPANAQIHSEFQRTSQTSPKGQLLAYTCPQEHRPAALLPSDAARHVGRKFASSPLSQRGNTVMQHVECLCCLREALVGGIGVRMLECGMVSKR